MIYIRIYISQSLPLMNRSIHLAFSTNTVSRPSHILWFYCTIKWFTRIYDWHVRSVYRFLSGHCQIHILFCFILFFRVWWTFTVYLLVFELFSFLNLGKLPLLSLVSFEHSHYFFNVCILIFIFWKINLYIALQVKWLITASNHSMANNSFLSYSVWYQRICFCLTYTLDIWVATTLMELYPIIIRYFVENIVLHMTPSLLQDTWNIYKNNILYGVFCTQLGGVRGSIVKYINPTTMTCIAMWNYSDCTDSTPAL